MMGDPGDGIHTTITSVPRQILPQVLNVWCLLYLVCTPRKKKKLQRYCLRSKEHLGVGHPVNNIAWKYVTNDTQDREKSHELYIIGKLGM